VRLSTHDVRLSTHDTRSPADTVNEPGMSIYSHDPPHIDTEPSSTARGTDVRLSTHDTQSPANTVNESDMLIPTHDPSSRIDTEHLGAERDLNMLIHPHASSRVDAIVIRQREDTSTAYSSRLVRDMGGNENHNDTELGTQRVVMTHPQTTTTQRSATDKKKAGQPLQHPLRQEEFHLPLRREECRHPRRREDWESSFDIIQ